MNKDLRIFHPIQVALMAILFSPLASAIMVGMDYKKFNKPNWWLVAVSPFVIIFIFSAIVLYLSEDSFLPEIVFPILLTYTYFLYQKKLEAETFAIQYRSLFESIKVGIISFLIIMPFYFYVLSV